MPTFEVTPGWLAYHPNPSARGSRCRPGQWMRTVTSSAPARRFRTRRAEIHAGRCVEGPALCASRPSRLQQERDRAGHLPWHGQPRAGRCPACVERAGPWHRHRRSQRHRCRAQGAARRRRARHPLQLRPPARGLHPARGTDGDCAPHRPARLACGDLLRGGRPARAVGLLYVAADDRRRRSHGAAGCEEASGRSRVRALRAHDARARQHLVEGQLPRATDRHRSAGP